ncbi:endo-1,4-beta-glucanase B [Caldivirga maquilingensis IC-167]|uniref:Endo-1,4-beta-glucanase B n=2 Tax=Caldivirga maquilingensis TaxID=76887 RepID=A8M9X3_CALMQ
MLKLIPLVNGNYKLIQWEPLGGVHGADIECIHVTPNVWNIDKSSVGTVQIEYEPQVGCLRFSIDFPRISIRHNVGVAAYSEVIYGHKPWGPTTCMDPQFKFPIKVNESKGLYSYVNYNVKSRSPDDSIFNIAYDLWLTTSPNLTNGPQPGDVEVMIWLYYHGQRPAGRLIGELRMPITLGDSEAARDFEVWVADTGIGIGEWAVVTFRIKDPIKGGLIGVNLINYIESAFKTLEELNPVKWRYGDLLNKYLNGIEFGSEFGNVSSGMIKLNWELCGLSLVKDSS